MDRLTSSDQQKVRKVSDERLRAKLIEAGYEKDDIDLTERDDLLAPYAEFLVQAQTRVSVSEPPAPAMGDNLPPGGRVSGDLGLEREMFEFDKRKWEAEERYREFEMKKWDDEREERRAEHREHDRKWEAERKDRKAELRLKEAELGLKKNEAAK